MKSRNSPGRGKWGNLQMVLTAHVTRSLKEQSASTQTIKGVLRVHCCPPPAPSTDDQMLWRLTEAPEQQSDRSNLGLSITMKDELLLLLLSHFSRVQLCATPKTAAHQAPPSLGFSRQEHWSGLHFLLQRTKVKSEIEVAQSCPTLSNFMDCSPPGSSVHGIFQARVLEWGAIAFSGRMSW